MTKLIAGSAIGTIVAAGVVFGVIKLIGPIPLSITQTTTNKQSSFDVTGQGEVTTAPDRAEINLGIQANDSSVQAVQDKGNRTINQITQDLLSMGVDRADIKTVNYSLYPNYDFRSGSQKINGYALNVSLQVKAKDFSKISQIVDTATKDGANQVGGVSFTLSDEKKKEVENQAREAAVKEAKAKAESLSSLAGVKLGKIINISENSNNNFPRPVLMEKSVLNVAGDAAQSAAPTNVEPGSTTFSLSVTLSYETL
jgi:uncharacterized protein YggE